MGRGRGGRDVWSSRASEGDRIAILEMKSKKNVALVLFRQVRKFVLPVRLRDVLHSVRHRCQCICMVVFKARPGPFSFSAPVNCIFNFHALGQSLFRTPTEAARRGLALRSCLLCAARALPTYRYVPPTCFLLFPKCRYVPKQKGLGSQFLGVGT